jgi:hypothetical protein
MQRAAWETVWIPQPALFGDEEDMQEIVSAFRKIQQCAKELAADDPSRLRKSGACNNSSK